MKKLLTALFSAPLVLALFPAAAQAQPDPHLKITSVTLNRTSVAVSGLNTVPVTVTVKGSFDRAPNQAVNVILERTGGSGGLSPAYRPGRSSHRALR